MRATRIIAGAVMSVGLALAGLSLGAPTASALPSVPHEWCPGMTMNNPPGPGAIYVWDMTVCHTWQYTQVGMGNVPWLYNGELQYDGSVWEGSNMPPELARECGNDGFTGIPVTC